MSICWAVSSLLNAECQDGTPRNRLFNFFSFFLLHQRSGVRIALHDLICLIWLFFLFFFFTESHRWCTFKPVKERQLDRPPPALSSLSSFLYVKHTQHPCLTIQAAVPPHRVRDRYECVPRAFKPADSPPHVPSRWRWHLLAKESLRRRMSAHFPRPVFNISFCFVLCAPPSPPLLLTQCFSDSLWGFFFFFFIKGLNCNVFDWRDLQV